MPQTPPLLVWIKNKRVQSAMAGLGYFVYCTSMGGVQGIDVTPLYLRIADVSCTRGVRESTGLSYGGPCGGVP